MELKTRPIAIDLFSGAGGMSLGFQRAGFNVSAAVDFDPIHVQAHAQNFPESFSLHADVSKLTGEELLRKAKLKAGTIDLLFGGPPCQGFSVGGRRQIEDERNYLLHHFARLASELRPRYIVVENVEGLLFKDYRRILDQFLKKLRKANFDYVENIKVLDARDFGVPQRRKRVFILAARKGLPLPSYPEPRPSTKRWTVRDALKGLPNVDRYNYLLSDDKFRGPFKSESPYASFLFQEFGKRRFSYERDGLAGCMRTIHSADTIARFVETAPGSRESISRFWKLDRDSFAPTLRAGSAASHGSYTAPRPIHPEHPRCITVREGARLHSFPDWFVFHPTKWHGFRQVGNSVPPLLAKAVAENVYRIIQK